MPSENQLDFATLPMEGDRYVVELEFAINLTEHETIEKLLFKLPKMSHILRSEKIRNEQDRFSYLLSELTGQPQEVIERLSVRDMTLRVAPLLEVLLGKSPETGKTSSEG